MDPKEILRHLQYRISVTPDSDPEKENAIRLRDRLLAKYGMRLEDLIEQRKHRIFGPLVKSDAKLVFQYFRRRLDAGAQEPPYNIDCFLLNIKKTARHTIELSALNHDTYCSLQTVNECVLRLIITVELFDTGKIVHIGGVIIISHVNLRFGEISAC